jgi:hypothetical protein
VLIVDVLFDGFGSLADQTARDREKDPKAVLIRQGGVSRPLIFCSLWSSPAVSICLTEMSAHFLDVRLREFMGRCCVE